MAATIKDVARMASLSIATVSKYLNGGHVIDANRQAIEHAIQMLDYHVNTMARGLKTRKTKSVGVLIPSVRMVFCMEMISAIESVLGQKDFSTLICDCQENAGLEERKMAFLLEKQVDGIITMPFSNSALPALKAVQAGVPVVLVDRKLPGFSGDCVLSDNVQLAFAATQELILNGHRRIGIICGPVDIYTTVSRLEGFRKAFYEQGLHPDADCIEFSDYSMEGGFAALNRLLDRNPTPTAILATNYETTMGALLAISQKNLSLPQDMSFIGFDGLQLAHLIQPGLTMAIQSVQQIGEQAARLMMDRISDGTGSLAPCPVREIVLPGELVKGKSVGRCFDYD